MTITQQTRRASSSRQKETVILFSVAGNTFALASSAIEEIRELAGLQEFPSRLSKVTRKLDRQGRRYMVVDAGKHFRLSSAQPTRLVVLRNLPIAIMVDSIDKMQEIQSIQALPEGFSGEERNWYRGLTLLKGKVIPVIKPEAFLSKAEITLLTAALSASEPVRAVAVTA